MPCNLPRDPEVEKSFWNEAKGLLAKGVEPEDVIRQLAKDHNLGTDAVGAVLQSKKLFQLTNEAWEKQAKLSDLRSAAKREANMADMSPFVKNLKRAYELPRKVLTTGHGSVIPFTHARNSMLIPGEMKIFQRTVGRAWSYMSKEAGSARWKADMSNLIADYRTNTVSKLALRAGLDIKAQSAPVGMGMSRWTRQSFDALKPMRLELFKKYYNQLEIAKAADHFAEAQKLAKDINHATGTVNTPPVVSKIMSPLSFAPKLRLAKYANAIDSFTSGFGAKRFAKVAAVNLGLLAINDLVNRNVFNSQDNVNWTDPTRADWMRMKVAGMTIPMSPLFETMRLPINAAATALNPNEDNKGKVIMKELTSAAHPAIGALYGAATGTDMAMGTKLPFKGVSQYMYGDHRDEKKVFGKWVHNKYAKSENWGEYGSGFLPIPAQPVAKEMAKEGVLPDTSVPFLKAYAETVLSGGAGTHAYPDVPYKNKP